MVWLHSGLVKIERRGTVVRMASVQNPTITRSVCRSHVAAAAASPGRDSSPHLFGDRRSVPGLCFPHLLSSVGCAPSMLCRGRRSAGALARSRAITGRRHFMAVCAHIFRVVHSVSFRLPYATARGRAKAVKPGPAVRFTRCSAHSDPFGTRRVRCGIGRGTHSRRSVCPVRPV